MFGGSKVGGTGIVSGKNDWLIVNWVERKHWIVLCDEVTRTKVGIRKRE